MDKQSMRTEFGRTAVARLEAGAIRCTEGALWITWKNGSDRILAAGETLELPAGSAVVAQAVGGRSAAWEYIESRDLKAERRRTPAPQALAAD